MRRVLLCFLLLALAGPATAGAAAPTVIDFNTIANNQAVSNQYAGSGVFFGQTSSFGLPRPSGRSCGNQPSGRTGGISGTSLRLDCRGLGEIDPDRQFSMAMQFTTERRDVRFDLQERTGSPAAVAAKVRAYTAEGTLVSEQTIFLQNAVQQVVITRPTAEIGHVVVFGELNVNDVTAGDILFDNLVAVLDDTPGQPKYKLIVERTSIGIAEGSTGTLPVTIQRFNGSVGPVTLTATTAANLGPITFDPPNAPGRDVNMLIPVSGASSGERSITLTASGGGALAGTNIGGPATITVTLRKAVEDYEAVPRRLVSGCPATIAARSIDANLDFAGGATLAARAPAGMTATATPGRVSLGPSRFGTYDIVVNPGSARGRQTVAVDVRPDGAATAVHRYPFDVEPVRVTSVPTGPLQRSRNGEPREVIVRGHFPSACPLELKDAIGQEWPITRRGFADGVDTLAATMPIRAVSGELRLRVKGGGELTRTPWLDVVDFRIVNASSVRNSDAGARSPDYTWGDFVRTFGKDDAELCPAPRGVMGWLPDIVSDVTCTRDPIAIGHFWWYQGSIQASPGQGLCSGWSTVARRWALGYYPNRGRAWNANFADGTDLKREVVRWQVAQHDESFQDALEDGFLRNAGVEHSYIRYRLDAVNPIHLHVAFRDKGGGHAVVAYGYELINDPLNPKRGGLRLHIYDPNFPYVAGEATDKGTRDTQLDASAIDIGPDGSWVHKAMGWSGPNDRLAVTDAYPAEDAELPVSLNMVTWFNSAGGAAPVKLAGIEADGQEVLGPDGEPKAGSGVRFRPDAAGPGAPPAYHLDKGKAYTFKLDGSAGGTYEQGLIGDGVAAQVSGIRTAPGQTDELTLRPGQPEVGFRSEGGGKVELNLVDQTAKGTRTATVALTSAAGGGDQVELKGGVVRIEHAGKPTSATVELATAGSGLPETVTTAPIPVGTGQTAELRPGSWSALSDRVALTVKAKSGKVVRRGTVKLRSGKGVSLGGVTARRQGGNVVVSGRVLKRGKAPALAAIIEQRVGGETRPGKAKALSGAKVKNGRFAITVPMGKVRRGAKLRATVTLVDRDAEMASAVKRVDVR